MNTIGLMVTMIFCLNGGVTKNDLCEDGTKPHNQTVYLLTKDEYKRNIVEIDLDHKTVFVLHEDGSVYVDKDFEVDATAVRFWKSLGDNLPAICDVIKKSSR